jgi:CheY-like chemotaxis protein
MTYVEPEPATAAAEWVTDPLRLPVLVVEDSPEEMLLYEKFLKGSGFHVVRAMTTRQARHALGQLRPAAIVLDILLRSEDAWSLLAEIKRDPQTRDIPVLIVSTVDDQAKGLALGAEAYAVKPVERRWLLDRLQALTGRQPVRRVLLIDDDEISRYLVRGWLDDVACTVVEARGGEEGLRRARQDPPDAIFLDLVMPDVSGFEVLERLRSEVPTRDIPVVVVTSKVLEDTERRRLESLRAAAVVSKAADRDAAVTQLRSVLVGAGLLPV